MSNDKNNKKRSANFLFEDWLKKRFQLYSTNYVGNTDTCLNKTQKELIFGKLGPVALKEDRKPEVLKSLTTIADIVNHDGNGNLVGLIEVKCFRKLDRSPIGDTFHRIIDEQYYDIRKNLKLLIKTDLPYCLLIGYYDVKRETIDQSDDFLKHITSFLVIAGIGHSFSMYSTTLPDFFSHRESVLSSFEKLVSDIMDDERSIQFDYQSFIDVSKTITSDLCTIDKEDELQEHIKQYLSPVSIRVIEQSKSNELRQSLDNILSSVHNNAETLEYHYTGICGLHEKVNTLNQSVQILIDVLTKQYKGDTTNEQF